MNSKMETDEFKKLESAAIKAFNDLRKVCPHLDVTDCGHPEIEFSCMSCSPANCPLMLEA